MGTMSKVGPIVMLSALVLPGCGGGASGNNEMYIQEYIASIQVTFLKGKCCGRLVLDSKGVDERAAIIAFAQYVASQIPVDGSGPADDAELMTYVPVSGEYGGWDEDLVPDALSGPWLVTTTAYDWINGGGASFDANGFQAVTGEFYEKDSEGWNLTLEVLYLETPAGARTGFEETGWNEGEKL